VVGDALPAARQPPFSGALSDHGAAGGGHLRSQSQRQSGAVRAATTSGPTAGASRARDNGSNARSVALDPRIQASAYAFGEECRKRGHGTRSRSLPWKQISGFASPFQDLGDETALGNELARAMALIEIFLLKAYRARGLGG